MEKLDKLFRIGAVRMRAKDGSNRQLIVEHRVGRDAGCFRFEDLMSKSTLQDEYKKECVRFSRKFRDKEDYEEVTEALYRDKCTVLRNGIRGFRTDIEKLYTAASIKPLMTWIPTTEKKSEDVFYIQAMVDVQTLKLAVGEPEDLMFYLWSTAKKTKSMAETYHESVDIAKVNSKLPMSKDLAHQLDKIANGDVDDRPPLLEFKG